MNCTIAVAQTDSTVGNLKKNIQHHIPFIKKAISKKAQIIVFPELSLSGYSVRDLNWDLALHSLRQEIFEEFLKLSNVITILVGGIEESDNFGIHNSVFVFEKGGIYTGHRKVYPPTYGMFEESRYFTPGREVKCFESRFGRLGILICEDLWHISLPYILTHDGAEILIAMAASPTRLSGDSKNLSIAEINTEQHQAYARLLSTYLVFCNRVGVEDGISFWGGSQVIDPAGAVVARAKYFKEDLIFAEIKDGETRRARRFSRHVVDDSADFTLQELQNAIHRSRNR